MPSKERRIPPLELREGESIFIHWLPSGDIVEVQLRGVMNGRPYSSRSQFSSDSLRRPPSVGRADEVRAELVAQIIPQVERRTNRPTKKPRW